MLGLQKNINLAASTEPPMASILSVDWDANDDSETLVRTRCKVGESSSKRRMASPGCTSHICAVGSEKVIHGDLVFPSSESRRIALLSQHHVKQYAQLDVQLTGSNDIRPSQANIEGRSKLH